MNMGRIGAKQTKKTVQSKKTDKTNTTPTTNDPTPDELKSLSDKEIKRFLQTSKNDNFQKVPTNFMKNHMGRQVTTAKTRNWEKLGWKGADSSSNLTAAERSHWKALGWNDQNWAGKADPPKSSKMSWRDLQKKGLSQHATALGYKKESWDKELVAGTGELASKVGKKAGLNTSQKEQLRVALRTVDSSLLTGANRDKAMNTLASLAKKGHLKTLDSRIAQLSTSNKQRHTLRQMALHHMMDGPKKADALLNLLNTDSSKGLPNIQKMVRLKSPDAQRLLFRAVLAGNEKNVKGLLETKNFNAFDNLNAGQQVKFAQLALQASTFDGDVPKVQKAAKDLVGHLAALKKNGSSSYQGRMDGLKIAQLMKNTPAVFHILNNQEKKAATVGLLQGMAQSTNPEITKDYKGALKRLKSDNPGTYKAFFKLGAKAIADGSTATKSFLRQNSAATAATVMAEFVAKAKIFTRGGSGPIALVYGTVAGVASSDKQSDMLANGMSAFVSGGLFTASTVGLAGAKLGLAATVGLGALSLAPGVIVGAWALYADYRVKKDQAAKLTTLMKDPAIAPD